MRQIIFRAWDGKKMYEPYVWDNRVFRNVHHLMNDNDYKDPLMQYTGLKDKNSLRIYEGDIVDFYGGEQCQGYWEFSGRGIVKYEQGSFYADEFGKGPFIFGELMHHISGINVIGNIYEHPHLLEG